MSAHPDKENKEVKKDEAAQAAAKGDEAQARPDKKEKKHSGDARAKQDGKDAKPEGAGRAVEKNAKTPPRLKVRFRNEIIPTLQKERGIKNHMQMPRMAKICLSMGVGKIHTEANILKQCGEDLSNIAGQRAVTTKAKKSEASFKIREGEPIGLRVTLRGDRMWEFLDRMVNVASPRIRDFRGFSKNGFDKKGNFSFGFTEQTIFHEVDLDKMLATQGMNVNIVFENSSPELSACILERIGFPFERGRN